MVIVSPYPQTKIDRTKTNNLDILCDKRTRWSIKPIWDGRLFCFLFSRPSYQFVAIDQGKMFLFWQSIHQVGSLDWMVWAHQSERVRSPRKYSHFLWCQEREKSYKAEWERLGTKGKDKSADWIVCQRLCVWLERLFEYYSTNITLRVPWRAIRLMSVPICLHK